MESTVQKTLKILREWGVSTSMAEGYIADSAAVLPQILEAVQTRIKDKDLFAYPASFEGDAPLLGFPAPARREWPSCQELLEQFNAAGVLLQAPLYWQLASALHVAARNAGVPLFINQPDNLALAQAALQRAEIDTVVSAPPDAARLAARLQEAGAAGPRLWILLRRADEPEWTAPKILQASHAAIAQEVHLFPGVALLTQCRTLAQEASPHFHSADKYHWEHGPDGARITSLHDPFPLIRYRLPFKLRQEAPCSCGKVLLTRT